MLNLCSCFPPNEDQSTEMTFDHVADAMLYISHTGASAGIYPSVRTLKEVCLSFAGVEERNVDSGSCWRCTRCCAPTSVERNIALDGVIDTQSGERGLQCGATFHNQGDPYATRAASESSAWSHWSAALRACVPVSTSKQNIELILEDFPAGSDKRIDSCSWTAAPASAAHRLSPHDQRAARWIVS